MSDTSLRPLVRSLRLHRCLRVKLGPGFPTLLPCINQFNPPILDKNKTSNVKVELKIDFIDLYETKEDSSIFSKWKMISKDTFPYRTVCPHTDVNRRTTTGVVKPPTDVRGDR